MEVKLSDRELKDLQLENSVLWMRGRMLLANPKSIGKELRGKHFWILMSRNDINWNMDLPVVAVPTVSHRDRTFRHATDIELSAVESPSGEPCLVQCGQIRVLDRRRIFPKFGKAVSDEVMARIEDNLLGVLGMDWVNR